MKESDIQRACLDYLTLKGIFHYRQNSGAYKTERGGFVRFGTPGSPDILCVIDGRYIGIEVKTPKKYQNKNQKAFQERLEEAGGKYFVVRSVEELIEALK